MKSHHMLHISPILSCPLGADMLHRRPYASSEECRTPKTPTARIPPPHRRRHPIRSPYIFPAVPFPTLRARPSANLPLFFDPSIISSMPPQLLELALFLFFCRVCGIDCVFYNSERACPPRISSILILLVPYFPTHPSPTHPQPYLVFYHHRFPLLLLISFPTSPPPPSLSLPLSPSLSLPPSHPPPKTHNQPATEQKPPKTPARGLGVSERKGPLSRKDEWIFFFS